MKHRTTVLMFVAIAGLTLAVAGCSKSSDKGGGGAGRGVSKATATAFKYLPKQAAAVYGVSFEALNKSSLADLAKSQLESSLPEQFKAIRDKCNIDILKELKTVVAAMGADTKDRASQIAVATGSFDKKKVNDCVNKSTVDGKKLSATEDGKLTVYGKEGSDKKFYAWWPSANTVVVSLAEDNKDGVLALTDAKGGLDKNSRLMGLVKDVNTSSVLWGVGDIRMMGVKVDKPKATLLEVTAGDGVKLYMRLRYPDSDGADKAKNAIADRVKQIKGSPFGGFVAPFLVGLKLSTKANDAVVRLELSKKLLKRGLGMRKMMGGRR